MLIPIPSVVKAYLAAALAVVVFALAAGLYIQTKRLETCKTEHAVFVAGVKAVGDAQERATKAINEANVKKVEALDAKAAALDTDLRATRKRLRDAIDSGRSFVPGPGAQAESPARACFDGPELDRALRSFAGEAADLVGEGQKAVNDLNSLR